MGDELSVSGWCAGLIEGDELTLLMLCWSLAESQWQHLLIAMFINAPETERARQPKKVKQAVLTAHLSPDVSPRIPGGSGVGYGVGICSPMSFFSLVVVVVAVVAARGWIRRQGWSCAVFSAPAHLRPFLTLANSVLFLMKARSLRGISSVI